MSTTINWAEKISAKFSASGVKETDVYDLLAGFLETIVNDKFRVVKNRVLLLKVMAFTKAKTPYLGQSSSSADLVIYPALKPGMDLETAEKVIRRVGQYGLGKWGGIYPAVILQVALNVTTGKLQLENMKAQSWRNMFPKAISILIAGPYRIREDIRFNRETSYFDLALAGFRDKLQCETNLRAMRDMIQSHLRVKWSEIQ